MRQIWTNCHIYNKKETPYDRAGRQAEQLFQEKWNRSGFAAADTRGRRNNAGVAAPKFEPNEYGPPEKKLQRRSSGSKNGRIAMQKVGSFWPLLYSSFAEFVSYTVGVSCCFSATIEHTVELVQSAPSCKACMFCNVGFEPMKVFVCVRVITLALWGLHSLGHCCSRQALQVAFCTWPHAAINIDSSVCCRMGMIRAMYLPCPKIL